MFIGELFEAVAKKILVIYPGRFQPFTKGHAAVYQHLCDKYGAGNVYVVTSDKVDPPRSPFNFAEKKAMITLTGVDPSHVIQDAQPYQAKGLVDKFDPSSTVLLFAVSEKDMAEDPRFQFKPKKDGSPSYFQPLTDLKKAKTLDKHAYITTVPTFNYEVLGKPANSATQIRTQFASADEATQKKIVTDLFGKFNPSVLRIMQEKLSAVTEGHDVPGGEIARKKHFDSLSKELQDLMRPRLDQGRGYWDSYYKASKQLRRNPVTESIESDNQISKIQQKYDVPWNEAAKMYHLEGVRVEDEKKEPSKPKKIDEEIIHSAQFRNFLIDIDDHYLMRARQRKVGHAETGRAITKFSDIKQQLQDISPGQQFWAFDKRQNIGLGMRKGSDKNNSMNFILKTVVRGSPPENGRTPIITIS